MRICEYCCIYLLLSPENNNSGRCVWVGSTVSTCVEQMCS